MSSHLLGISLLVVGVVGERPASYPSRSETLSRWERLVAILSRPGVGPYSARCARLWNSASLPGEAAAQYPSGARIPESRAQPRAAQGPTPGRSRTRDRPRPSGEGRKEIGRDYGILFLVLKKARPKHRGGARIPESRAQPRAAQGPTPGRSRTRDRPRPSGEGRKEVGRDYGILHPNHLSYLIRAGSKPHAAMRPAPAAVFLRFPHVKSEAAV